MKTRELEFLMINLGVLINLTKSVNINKEAIDHHVTNLRIAQKKLDGYTEQYNNQEYMKTLSPAEKQCLSTNAQNVYMAHQSIQKEIDYLDMSKQPTYIFRASNEMENVYILLEYLIDLRGKSGDTILPRLTCIRPDTFDKGKYKNQIDSLFSELEAIAYDFHKDHVETITEPMDAMSSIISDHLIIASMWIKKEKERLTTEPVPEIRKIKIPAETTPEIPKGPDTDVK
jgi:hypothetical protein